MVILGILLIWSEKLWNIFLIFADFSNASTSKFWARQATHNLHKTRNRRRIRDLKIFDLKKDVNSTTSMTNNLDVVRYESHTTNSKVNIVSTTCNISSNNVQASNYIVACSELVSPPPILSAKLCPAPLWSKNLPKILKMTKNNPFCLKNEFFGRFSDNFFRDFWPPQT